MFPRHSIGLVISTQSGGRRPTLAGKGAFGVDRPNIGSKNCLQSHLRPKGRRNFSVFDIDQVWEEPVLLPYCVISHVFAWLLCVSSLSDSCEKSGEFADRTVLNSCSIATT